MLSSGIGRSRDTISPSVFSARFLPCPTTFSSKSKRPLRTAERQGAFPRPGAYTAMPSSRITALSFARFVSEISVSGSRKMPLSISRSFIVAFTGMGLVSMNRAETKAAYLPKSAVASLRWHEELEF